MGLGSWVRTQKEFKVLAIAGKFINNKERKNRLQRAGHDEATEHTQRKNRNNTSRERQATPREANSPGKGCRVFKAGSFA